MGLFLFSLDSKIYMLMGYIYCHSESMFVALNIVVKEKREEEGKKQCPGNAKAKGRFLYQFYPKCSTMGMYC